MSCIDRLERELQQVERDVEAFCGAIWPTLPESFRQHIYDVQEAARLLADLEEREWGNVMVHRGKPTGPGWSTIVVILALAIACGVVAAALGHFGM